MHDHHSMAVSWHLVLPGVLLVLVVAYLWLAAHATRAGAGRRWPAWRTLVFGVGTALTVWALASPLHEAGHGSFTAHMAQHLVVGMLGPFLMVLGAPVTLVLRWGPRGWRPVVGRFLHTRFVRVVAHPLVALFLSVGSLPVLYGSGLYAASTGRPWLHALVHLHFFASGYLFAWVICGPDPAPRRPSVPRRLVVLGVAVAVHATVSQLMYAGVFPAGVDPVDLRRGATLMYYGGDLIELALAVALVTQWRPDRRPQAAARRRSGARPDPPVVTAR